MKPLRLCSYYPQVLTSTTRPSLGSSSCWCQHLPLTTLGALRASFPTYTNAFKGWCVQLPAETPLRVSFLQLQISESDERKKTKQNTWVLTPKISCVVLSTPDPDQAIKSNEHIPHFLSFQHVFFQTKSICSAPVVALLVSILV